MQIHRLGSHKHNFHEVGHMKYKRKLNLKLCRTFQLLHLILSASLKKASYSISTGLLLIIAWNYIECV